MKLRAWIVGLLIGVVAVPALQGQSVNTQIAIAINNLVTGVTPFTAFRTATSSYLNWGATQGVNGYGIRDNAGNIEAKNSGGAWTVLVGGSGNPTNASYWTRVTESSLTNETALASLATALIINTTTTGVPTAYAGATCTAQYVQAISAVGAATCATVNLLTESSGTLTVSRGGTGLTIGTSGGVLAFTGPTTLATSGALTASALVLGGGAGAVPTAMASLGTTTTLLHGNAAGAPTFGAVSLTADVSGILPTANGGTANAFFTVSGPSASAKTFTFPNASSTVLTSNTAVTAAQGGTGQTVYVIGDLLQASATTTLSRLAAVATGNALISGGIGTVSSWGKIGLTTHVSGTLPATNGGTGLASYVVGDLLYANSTTTLAPRAAVALGSVLISQGTGTAPVWSADARLTSINLGSANLTFSGATPTISAGFGTSPSVTAGTAASMRINVGTGGTATSGTIGLPTAATGWNCSVENLTGTLANVADQRTVQISSTTTTAVVENQTVSTGAALAWSASDVLGVTCVAF